MLKRAILKTGYERTLKTKSSWNFSPLSLFYDIELEFNSILNSIWLNSLSFSETLFLFKKTSFPFNLNWRNCKHRHSHWTRSKKCNWPHSIYFCDWIQSKVQRNPITVWPQISLLRTFSVLKVSWKQNFFPHLPMKFALNT